MSGRLAVLGGWPLPAAPWRERTLAPLIFPAKSLLARPQCSHGLGISDAPRLSLLLHSLRESRLPAFRVGVCGVQ